MSVIKITDSAAAQIKVLLEKSEPRAEALLVSVVGGGCSGYKYKIEYLDKLENKPEFAEEVTKDGITVVIDPMAEVYIVGTTMDYVETLSSSGFEFKNPNQTAGCGCGKSFSV